MTAPTSSATCAASATTCPDVEQTGSNFGTEVQAREPVPELGRQRDDGRRRAVDHQRRLLQHVVPRVPGVDRARTTSSATTSPTPPQGRTGDNCLLATKVMVPIDGEVREGVGLLGSPSFEIPRRSSATARFDHLSDAATSCAAASPPRTGTTSSPSGCSCSSRWFYVFVVTLLGLAAVDLYGARRARGRSRWPRVVSLAVHRRLLRAGRAGRHGVPAAAAAVLLDLRPPTSGGTSASGRCAADGVPQALQRHPVQERDLAAAGRPDRPPGLRRRLLHDRRRTLVTIGDDCTLNAGSDIQCHSQEDGAFKSDRITIGAGCTLGVGAFVHYGVTMGDGAVLAPDSFLMKGEDVPPHAQWGGNPATELRDDRQSPPQVRGRGTTSPRSARSAAR